MSSPLIGSYNNCTNPTLNLMPIDASLYNNSGCLTVHFVSDASVEGTGWSASVDCHPQCQNVVSNLDLIQTSPQPDTNYIAICPGQQVSFEGFADFPENDYIYHQSNSNSTFTWHFGDGTSANGTSVSHTYDDIGGYDVTLVVTDQLGCESTNSIETRVITAGSPFSSTYIPDPICTGETLELLFSSLDQGGTTINGDPFDFDIQTTLGVSDTTYLPDGNGECYTTSVTFNCFAPGQTLDNAWDILSVCGNMEHSFLGDLEISLICPNGQSIILKEFADEFGDTGQGGGIQLGEPDPNDDGVPGLGYDYCWSPTPNLGTMVDETVNFDPLPAESYAVYESFAGLVGCPLNGEWTIEICDNWEIDDGYIFSWELSLNPDIAPDQWSYTVDIDQMSWTDGPYIISSQDSSAIINPTTDGYFEYTYTVVDEIGCEWDTSVFVTVYPIPEVNLGDDSIYCNVGGSVILDAGIGSDSYLWQDGSVAQTLNVASNGIYSVTVSNALCSSIDTVDISFGSVGLTSALTDITCNGESNGAIDLNMDAGAPPFTFSWNNGALTEDLINISAGNYSITVSDANYCSTTQFFTINEPDQLLVSSQTEIHICKGSTAHIVATASGGTAPYSYIWNNDSTEQNIYVGPDQSTNYTVTVTDIYNCPIATSTTQLTVYPDIEVEMVVSDTIVCPGDEIEIVPIISGGLGGPYMVYLEGELTNLPAVIRPEEDHVYSISVSDNCENPKHISLPIALYDEPEVNFGATVYSGCFPLEVQFDEIGGIEAQTYLWNFGEDGTADNNKSPVYTYDQSGDYDISLTVLSQNGCSHIHTWQDTISIHPAPNVLFYPEPYITSIMKSKIRFDNRTSGADSYLWDFGDGKFSILEEAENEYNEEGEYIVTLTATNDYGCVDANSVVVEIVPEFTFYAPTAFLPENGGTNNLFKVYSNCIDPRYFHLYILDRWGELVFQTNNVERGWDGKIKGRQVGTNSVYSWIVNYRDIKGGEHVKSGSVTLIK